VTTSYDISEDMPYDLSSTSLDTTFTLTNTAYDIVINNLPFIASVSNQNPYRRETAQYRKDQFDNSQEPGEQSLTGWWLRSQTSWHNGAGVTFYDPGTDYQHTSHRFSDSRGIDVWTIGQSTLLPEVFHGYTGANGINAATGRNGASDALVSGDSAGMLKRVSLSGDSAMTASDFYYTATSYPRGHNGTVYSFLSVTTDGSNYYAACKRGIHTGTISTLSSDNLAFCFSTTDRTDVFIKYIKGYVLFGLANGIYNMSIVPSGGSRTISTHNHSGGTDSLPTGADIKLHQNSSWIWNDATALPESILISGNGGNNGEVWQVKFDETTTNLGMADAVMVMSLPEGETINAIHYYLGYLALATSSGVRICPVSSTGVPVLGPLLLASTNAVNGFTERGTYLYAATKLDDGAYTNAALIRIDLSQQFDDGTFAYANDLEYRSSLDEDSSDATEVYVLDDRLVMVVEEDSTAGELQVEHSTDKRNTGWLQTGKIRYGTVEPKFFRYINAQCTTGAGDNITINVIKKDGSSSEQAVVTEGLSNLDILLSTIQDKQEYVSFKFTFNNVTDDQELPILEAYQIKAVPGTRRQRLIQYPLSCFDTEMDRYNVSFGYSGRAIEYIQLLEALEESGQFITITDYRTGDQYQGVIEEVRFTNESSPDKESSGFGGLLLVTVRKL